MSASRGVYAAELTAPRWYAHGWNTPVVYRLGSAVAERLPRQARLQLAAAVASLARVLFPAERRAVRSNVMRILPHASARQREALVGSVFRHFAVCFADLLTTNRSLDAGRLLAAVEGERCLHDALAARRGLVVVTAHVGNWELAGRLLAARITRPTHVVVAPETNPQIEQFLRGGPGPVRFVSRTRPTAVLQLVAALRRGEIVAVQGDRALGDRSDVPVRFFDSDAPFPVGPFVLARASGAPVVPAFCLLGRDRRYTVTIGEPIRVEGGGEHRALARWVATLESVVRRHPEQWFNFFDVWRHAPA